MCTVFSGDSSMGFLRKIMGLRKIMKRCLIMYLIMDKEVCYQYKTEVNSEKEPSSCLRAQLQNSNELPVSVHLHLCLRLNPPILENPERTKAGPQHGLWIVRWLYFTLWLISTYK